MTKKLLCLLLLLQVLSLRAAVSDDNYLHLPDVTVKQGETIEVQMLMTNTGTVSAIQGKLTLPAGLSVVKNDNGRVDAQNINTRSEGFTLSTNVLDDGSLTFAQYSADGFTYEGNEGGIFTFKIKADETATADTYSLTLSNVVLSIGGVGYDIPDRTSTLTIEEPAVYDGNYLHLSDVTVKQGETIEVQMLMTNMGTVSAIQGKLTLPAGLSVVKNDNGRVDAQNNARSEGFTLSTNVLDDGSLTFAQYSADGFTYEGNEGGIFTFKIKADETATADTYSLTLSNVVLSIGGVGYDIPDRTSTLTIGAADAVTVTATSYTIKYGDAIPEFAFTSEGATLDGTPSITCEATATSPVGEYAIVITKGSVTNYNDHYVNGKLTIEKAPLTISGGTYTMKQGEELPTFTATYDGFKNEETEDVLTSKPTLTTEATSASEPGEYSVTVSGAAAQNYEITYVPGTLTVGAADAVTVTATSYTIKYGDAIPEFAFTSEGATLEGTPSITCEATATSPVGEYAIVITKGSVTNYNDHYVNGKLTIEKAPLTISGGTYTMKQGEELPAFVASYDGFKNEETEDVLTTKPTLTTTATSASEPGDYEVTVAGAEAQNYEITYVPGTLTIGAADAVTVTATSYTIKYGDAIPEFAYTSEGATLEGTPSITCEATATSPVGEYAIVITKGSVTNYNDHYVNGTLTIEKAPLTISGGTYTMKQGEELPTFVAIYDGFKNEETEDVLTTKPTLTTTATSASEPGDYEVTVAGAEAQNYEITYVPGTLTIGAADAVTVTATSYTIKYGDAIPEFAFTSEGATLDGTPSITCEATATSPVGEYAIVITKGSVTNYNDHYVNGKLTIEKAPLTISGGTYTMKQGEELPTFTATYDGFKNEETEDVLTTKPTLSTEATSASEPGEYSVTVSGAAAQNYEITYVPGTLTVGAADAVTVTATSYTIKYGDAIPEFAFTSEGATLEGTPSITCEATATSPVGEYAIVITKGSVTNYNDHYVNGKLTIEKAPLTISGGTYTMKQGEELPTFTATYDGFKNEETEDVLTTKPTLSTEATSASEPGEYAVTVSGAAAQNYEITYVPGTLTVEEPAVTLGDVNMDGKVNIGDVIAVINIIAGKTNGYNLKAADANQDNKINIGDVVRIINIIAGKN